jgi:hypothetical protein
MLDSKKAIRRAGKDEVDETIVTFRKDPDGTYTRITETIRRDCRTGGVKPKGKSSSQEAGPFELVKNKSDGFDDKMAYQDFDGSTQYMYFRKLEDNDQDEIDGCG